MTNTTTQIIWNGVDGYIEVANLNQDHNFTTENGVTTLFTTHESFKSFPVIEVNRDEVEKDEDGELILDGLFVTESFRIYREA